MRSAEASRRSVKNLEIAYKTDVGKLRELNEDSLFAKDCGDFAVAAVADGMGGHNAGEIASLLATVGIEDFISGCDMSEDTEKKLLSCFEKLNSDIYDKAVTTHGLIGMGTTLTIAVTVKNKAFIAHVGDTRAYVFSDGLTQITNDHSYVEELRQMGRISKEEAKVHPGRNQLTRAVGTEKTVKADTYHTDMKKGDILLLTSDGLTNMLEDERIEEILRETPDLNTACEELVYEANENGGSDNITVVALKY